MPPRDFPLWQARSPGCRWRDCSRRTSLNLELLSQCDQPIGQTCTIWSTSGSGKNYNCAEVGIDGSYTLVRQGVELIAKRVNILMIHSGWDESSNKVKCVGMLSGEMLMEFEVGEVAYKNWGTFTWYIADKMGLSGTHLFHVPSSVINEPATIELWKTKPENRKHVRTLLDINSVGPEPTPAKRLWRMHRQRDSDEETYSCNQLVVH
jgi:hypothetical protein